MVSTNLKQFFIEVVSNLGYEFVGHELISQSSGALVRIYIDSETGVTTQDCEKVNRSLNAQISVEHPSYSGYGFEISSPGVYRRLFTLEHYTKFIGQRIKVKLVKPINQQYNFNGTLQQVDGEKITISLKDEVANFDYSNIDRAHLIPEWDTVN